MRDNCKEAEQSIVMAREIDWYGRDRVGHLARRALRRDRSSGMPENEVLRRRKEGCASAFLALDTIAYEPLEGVATANIMRGL